MVHDAPAVLMNLEKSAMPSFKRTWQRWEAMEQLSLHQLHPFS